MTKEELYTIVTTAGYACRVKGDEVVLHICYFCGNDHWNLELNAGKGNFGCWVCRAGGRLETLLEQLTGQTYHIVREPRERTLKPAAAVALAAAPELKTWPITEVPTAQRYLARRGLDLDTVAAFGLAVCVDETHPLHGRLVIPMKDFWRGRTLGWIGRSFTGLRPKYLSTLPQSQVTGWRAPGKATPCIVVEGHLDGIAVRRAGYSAAVLSGTSTPDVEAWAARLPAATTVMVMLDGDAVEAGRRTYWALAAQRGEDRLSLILLPSEQDPADLGPAGIRGLVEPV